VSAFAAGIGVQLAFSAGMREATANLIEFEAALEDVTAAGGAGRQHVVAGYNEDDCRATLALRDWLEERRLELAGQRGEDLPRPGVAPEELRAPEDPEVTRIRSALLAGVSAEAVCEILHKAFPRRRVSRKAYHAGSRPGCSSWS